MLTRTAFIAIIGICIALVSQPTCVGQGPGTLPFASTYRRPAVSAYQQLGNFSNTPQAIGTAYQSLVQPLMGLEQTQIEQISQGRRIGSLQSKIDASSAAPSRLTDQTIRPTGHSATFLNYSHFYPSAR